MIRRKPTIISIADEEQIAFLLVHKDGRLERQTCLPMDHAPADGRLVDGVPKWVRQATHALLVVPDYWIGNHYFEFRARKRSIISAFIERKLKLDQPSLTDVVDFYDYAMVQDQDHRQMLYCTYLQDPMAYALYRRLEALGASPHRITTPALIWQSRLNQHADEFAKRGIGFVHLTDGDCFLYLYHLGQFLFSRHIQLPPTSDDPSEIYNLLNYEINQSLYLYSQKSKRSADSLYILTEDPSATAGLSDLLGRELLIVPPSPEGMVVLDETKAFPVCRGFSTIDLNSHNRPCIANKTLRKEITWRPVQWAGMAIGIVLVVLLAVEAGYLYIFQEDVQRRQSTLLASSTIQDPDQVFDDLYQIVNEINSEMGRPSGSGVMMRTLLALPDAVSLQNVSLDTSEAPRLTLDALVDANHPDAFKIILDEFIDRVNRRFNLVHRPLRKKDIQIRLERKEDNDHQPLYLIHLSFELT